jgi:Holliday junction resolvasome RuvABC ATP-dependent DNA helicase subunit
MTSASPRQKTWRAWIRRILGQPEPRAEYPARNLQAAPVKQHKAGDAFTPTRPGGDRRALVGRRAELTRILEAICDEYAHVVLYSERGRGKTSLSNLAIEGLRNRGVTVARFACEADTDFDSMLRGLMRDLPNLLLADAPTRAAEGCEAALPDRDLRAADVAALATRLTCQTLVFVIDEFDRITDQATRTRLADTIKLLSDRGIRIHFMIVGVSATLEQIIGQHPSIQRNIMAIHLPLLTDDEIELMLTRGAHQANILFSDEAKALVCFVARGMPYMAQLLGLRITQSTLRHGAGQVTRGDLKSAVQRLIDEAGSAVLSIYSALCESAPGEDMADVLRRVANAEQDSLGRMYVSLHGNFILAGGCRISQSAWSLLLASGVYAQPLGSPEIAQINDRPLLYHVQLLAARDHLAASSHSPALMHHES